MANILIPTIASILVLMIYLIVVQIVAKKQKTGERLKRIMETTEQSEPDENFLESLRSEKEASELALIISHVFTIFGVNMEDFRQKNQLRFYQAGIQSPDAHIYYLLFSRVVSAIVLMVAVFVATQSDAGLLQYIMALFLALLAIFGADALIKNWQENRKKVLQRSFPDALDLLLACVESGLALDGALLRVCKELGAAHPVITQELNRTRIELSLLNDRAQALNNLAERNDMLAFRALVTALLQSEKFGTSLTDTLRVMSEDYRTQRLMKAEEKAGRIPALITVPLILFLLPALFIIILGPAVITTLNTLHMR